MISLSSTLMYAQSFVSPTLSDQYLSDVTTSVFGTPDSDADDVTINCDMLNDGSGNAIKAIAWDEGTGSNVTHVYFEDGQGNSVIVELSGVHPDIVLGHNADGHSDYRAAVIYIDRVSPTSSYVKLAFYDLTSLGGTGFTATPSGSPILLSTTDLGTVYDTRPIPHIDMWSDNSVGATVNGYPGMWDFAVTWNEANQVHYNWGNISSATLYDSSPNGQPVNASITSQLFTDVACYTDLSTGNKIAAFSYVDGTNIYVYERNFSATPVPAFHNSTTFSQGITRNLFPRIEAMSQWNSSSITSPWLTVVSHGSTCHVYTTATGGTGTDLTTTLLNGGDFKSTAVAAGIGDSPGEPPIGNSQFTPGYFEWTGNPAPPLTNAVNYYTHAVDAVTGTLIDLDYYVINTNAVAAGPAYNLADVSKSLALSNCSNSGDYVLSVWYNDANAGAAGATGDIWFKLLGNGVPMQFRIGQIANLKGEPSVYPNPAKDKIFLHNVSGAYSIYNVTGMKVRAGLLNTGSIDVAALPAGLYLLKADGKTYKFSKL